MWRHTLISEFETHLKKRNRQRLLVNMLRFPDSFGRFLLFLIMQCWMSVPCLFLSLDDVLINIKKKFGLHKLFQHESILHLTHAFSHFSRTRCRA